MKNIIVPTDFSDNAKNALRYAINIANKFGSAIHLVNGTDMIAATGIYTDVNNMIHETAMNKLKEIVQEESKSIDSLSIIVPKLLRGDVVGAICDYAKDVKADLIVMGTQGASGFKEVFVGTVAQGVINGSSIPVIVVPKEAKILKPQNVALAIDNSGVHSNKVLQPFKKLVKAFESKTVVFHFNQQYELSEVDASTEAYLDGIEYSTHNYYSDEQKVEKVIDQFVESEGVGLLTMIRRKRSFIDRIFHKSVTAKEVFHSKVPLLIL